jgi:hypothetical protein
MFDLLNMMLRFVTKWTHLDCFTKRDIMHTFCIIYTFRAYFDTFCEMLLIVDKCIQNVTWMFEILLNFISRFVTFDVR